MDRKHQSAILRSMFDRILKRLRGKHVAALHASVAPLHPALLHPKVISLAADFSPTPSGITDEDGQYNATRFLDEHLLPALKQNEYVRVDLEGLHACAASFVHGAFAPLVTRHEYSPEYLREHLQVLPGSAKQHDDTAELAFHYIDHAANPDATRSP